MPIRSVRIRGPFRGPGGYDHHVRAFVRHLVLAGVAVQLLDMPFWSPRRLPGHLRDPWFDTLRRDVGASVFLQFCMPHQVTSRPGMTNVNYTMFEATSVPKLWVQAGNRSSLTIVPEDSSRKAWLAGGMPDDRLRICPLGIDPALFAAQAEPLPIPGSHGELVTNRRFRFLNMSEILPRKNLKGLLHAWLVATDRQNDAVLILKLGSELPADHATVHEWISELEKELGKRFIDAAPIVFFNDLLADADMPRLYATATHYISLSHGEGWDLPMMEAAASGLLLIAPDHSAYQTYLNTSIATLIPSSEVPAHASGDQHAFFENAKWWEPDPEAAIDAIRLAIRGLDQPVASPRDYVLGHWTWERATARLIEILTEVENQSRPE